MTLPRRQDGGGIAPSSIVQHSVNSGVAVVSAAGLFLHLDSYPPRPCCEHEPYRLSLAADCAASKARVGDHSSADAFAAHAANPADHLFRRHAYMGLARARHGSITPAHFVATVPQRRVSRAM